MRSRFILILAAGLVLVALATLLPRTVSANSPSLARTHTVGFVYVTTYKNRLLNAQAAFNQLQEFFDKVQWKPKRQYSFLRDVMGNSVRPEAGYVDTPLGYGFGSCGASSLLNKLVKTAMFRDSDGKEKPVFRSINVWTWVGDKTYGKYGATIFLDTETGKHTKDYVWELNPDYNGPTPKFTTHFDMQAETVDISMEYGDEVAGTEADATAAATAGAAPTKAATSQPTKASTSKTAATSEATSQTSQTISSPAAPVPPGAAAVQVATAAPTQIPATKVAEVNNVEAKAVPVPVQPPADVVVRLPPSQMGASLTRQLMDLIKQNRFGVSVIPVEEAAQIITEVGVNQDRQTFVASAFKGPLALYFFENISPLIWKSIPVRYWPIKDEKDVPQQYRANWNLYKDILYNVWTMAVWSENDSTGNVLDYVYRNSDASKLGDNPITAFNNWTHTTLGMGLSSGLRSWLSGRTLCSTCLDNRYGKESFVYHGKILVPNNTYSPRDLALAYVHLAEVGKQLGYFDTAAELLGTLRGPAAPSMIQYYLRRMGIQTASKDGFVGPDDTDSDGYYISVDAGLLTLADGKQVAVAFMAFDSGNLMDDAVIMTGRALVPNYKPTKIDRR
ncbi:MAG: hypothetical protein ABI947_13675 [Chloroflexota bacterium]